MQTQNLTYNLDTSPLKNGFFQFGGGQEISGGNSKGEIDYYPFGMLLPNRNGDAEDYRYGFQGQENDNEIKGDDNSVNYKYRMHDPRVGRFFAVDPLESNYPFWTPYAFSGNQVIQTVELEGLEPGKNENKNENKNEKKNKNNDNEHIEIDEEDLPEFEQEMLPKPEAFDPPLPTLNPPNISEDELRLKFYEETSAYVSEIGAKIGVAILTTNAIDEVDATTKAEVINSLIVEPSDKNTVGQRQDVQTEMSIPLSDGTILDGNGAILEVYSVTSFAVNKGTGETTEMTTVVNSDFVNGAQQGSIVFTMGVLEGNSVLIDAGTNADRQQIDFLLNNVTYIIRPIL